MMFTSLPFCLQACRHHLQKELVQGAVHNASSDRLAGGTLTHMIGCFYALLRFKVFASLDCRL